ncbi:hypothetical protein FB451DRAFT_1229511 [Mycena latifolia]|nr:hypothetical protein FB451DRAFT_1229511 [Mycena latifolia]
MLSWIFPWWTQWQPMNVLLEPLEHQILNCLRDLIQIGAYNSIFREMETFLPVEESSLDHPHNREIIDSLRKIVRTCRLAWFFACMTFLRHAHRWGVTPIVSEAQNESRAAFPNELVILRIAIQQRFGIDSPSGCMTSICYSNMAAASCLHYSVTVGMHEEHRQMLPAYRLFAESIAFIDLESPEASRDALKSANVILKLTLKSFFSTMVDSNMPYAVWMAYVQRFQGWTVGGMDGISGGQSLTFRTLDSFLGIRPWPTPEKEPVAKERGYDEVTAELDSLVKPLRTYESVYHPERLHMTVGISVVHALDEDHMIDHLNCLDIA